MNVKQSFPPNYEQILKVFPHVKENPYVMFTYGSTLFSPSSTNIPEDLMVHEKTHEFQQANDPESWWNKYLSDTSFRLSQELDAYKRQYKFVCNKQKDKNIQSQFLHILAIALSSNIYGNMVSYSEAKNLLQN